MASVEHQAAQDMHNPAGAPIAGEAAARDLHDSAVAAAPLPKMQQPQKTASKQQHDSPVRPSSEEQQADQPSARRERKKTEFFQPEAKAEAAKLQIKEGQGTKLGDIPNIAFRLSKVTGKDELLEDLHQLCYGSKGKLSMRKKEIQAFSGLADDAGKLVEKAKGLLSRFRNDHLHHMLDLLDIPRSELKDKESKIDKVIEFLKAPSQLTDKDLAAKDAQKKAAAAKKRERKQTEDDKKSAKKPKKAKKEKHSVKEDTKEGAEEESGEAAAAVGADEEPNSTAEAESMPDDEELKKEVLGILEGVDVQEFNIKMLMNKLNSKYKADLKDKKPTIKAIAIAYCAQKGSQKHKEAANSH